MDLFESLDHAFETLFEDVESRMDHLLQVLLGKKSMWPGKTEPNAQEDAKNFLRDMAKFDPTTGKNYMTFIAKQVAARLIRLPEDGQMLKEALEKFIAYSRKANWKKVPPPAAAAEPGAAVQPPTETPRYTDAMQYSHWRDIEKAISEYEKETQQKTVQTTQNAESILAKSVGDDAILVLDVDIRGLEKQIINYKIYKITTPIAAAVYGLGTKWCTGIGEQIYKAIQPSELSHEMERLTSGSHKNDYGETESENPWMGLPPEVAKQIVLDLNDGNLNKKQLRVPNIDRMSSALSTAQSYMRSGPLFIIKKNNAPYMQLTHDGSQIMDINDDSLLTVSPALTAVLRELMNQPQPEVASSVVRNMRAGEEISQSLVKRLTDFITRSDAVRAKKKQQEQQRQQRPPAP